MPVPGPVSYTHLDVYKRQGQDHLNALIKGNDNALVLFYLFISLLRSYLLVNTFLILVLLPIQMV